MNNSFGEKLKRFRSVRDWSQDKLAEKLGTSKQVISRYETSQRTPKITVAKEYAEKLGVPLSYLIDDNIPAEELVIEIPQEELNKYQAELLRLNARLRTLNEDQLKNIVNLIKAGLAVEEAEGQKKK